MYDPPRLFFFLSMNYVYCTKSPSMVLLSEKSLAKYIHPDFTFSIVVF